ncbi:ATP-dependent helicase [Streptomyces polyrhachis]|uniref:DNA 3'-5' helicase n=1 Tax=Streptomyces polyrhachis TaxID=1282885 RepID=A0ABW2GL06_9ACTN
MHVSAPSPTATAATSPYRLVKTPVVAAEPPVPDRGQRAVLDHDSGPLLVLAGPGTGKTTTLVEAVAERIRKGTEPERILVLTFSRAAAVELRDRMAARLGSGAGSAATPQATTFHSFCYALVRAHQGADLFAEPLRLLSGPEQDVFVRELLAGVAARPGALLGDGTPWPDELRACLTTRGFADEVRAVLARSRELGLRPEELAAFAGRSGRPDWAAAAAFLAEYLDVLDMREVLDYSELVHRAAVLARRPEVSAQLAARYDAVFVDEYQDTDAAQVRLLRELAGQGRTLLAFGDPDQSIYAFRGADIGGILNFPHVFPRRDGTPADVAVLGTSRRSGRVLLDATRELTRRMPLPLLPAETVQAHRALDAVRGGGRVEVYTYPTPGAELDNVADILRRAHLEDGIAWGEMAVLVRAGGRSIPSVRRALTSAGVPLEVSGGDLALRHEPAVAPLLLALRVAAEGALGADRGGVPATEAEEAPVATAQAAPVADGRGDPLLEELGEEPPPESEEGAEGEELEGATSQLPSLDAETATTLLMSPLGGLDAADLRRLGRALREEERAGGRSVPRPSDVLVAEALADPRRLVAHEGAHGRGARRLAALLAGARSALAGGATAEEALWLLWDGTPWPQRLERAARRGGAGGRNADRDLDAVCALFETAARAEERAGGQGALNFLEEVDRQDIAADVLSRRAARPDAVRLMTAHRSKGLQWRLVVVAGVQEGLWPDLRRRGSLLEADRIAPDGIAEPLPPGALLAEERRLFYVAATRARDRLVVTAVKAAAEDGETPSRFLGELGVEPKDIASRPRRPLNLTALVAELRATTVDPDADPGLREAAARRLAYLAALNDDGQPLVPAAHPQRWWGLDEPTRNAVPVRDPEQPVALSGSALELLVDTCSLQWFLGREVKADTPASSAQGFGLVVHALADEVASGRTPADLDVLMERLDTVWEGLAFDAPWKSAQEKENARAALERFLRWHVLERGGRRAVGSEHGFDVTLKAGEFEVRVRGSMDRVEEDAEGRAYVVDFKTGKQKPSGAEIERNAQLAVYQAAVAAGAADELFDGRTPRSGGAELVHLRLPAPVREGGETMPAVQHQEPLPDTWTGELLATAAARVLDERFRPTPGAHCSTCGFRSSCSARPEGRQIVE